jgi:hypothetical protein
MNAPIIALVTAFSGPPDVLSPPIADVEVVEGTDSTHVFAYDPDGEVAAEIVVWGRDGEVRFDALFPDGFYLSLVTDGESVTVDSDDAEEAAARMGEIHDFLSQIDPQAAPAPCAIAVATGVFHAVTANPLVVVEAVLAACECLPLIVDEWEGYHCPYFG